MVHVPENVFTVRDFAGHVSRLLGRIPLVLLRANARVQNDERKVTIKSFAVHETENVSF